ncbi:MAG: hypothetical protein ACLQDQ_05420 [Myxococcaceae bacterium]
MRYSTWLFVSLAACGGSLNVGRGTALCTGGPDGGSDGGLVLGLQSSSPWPMYQAGPRLNGRAAAVGPTQPTAKWFVPGNFLFQPSIAADGTIYAVTDDVNGSTLQAIRPDGTLGWSLAPLNSEGGEGFNGTPAIRADGSLVIGTSFDGDGGLYAIAPSGCVEWVAPLADNAYSSPTVAPDGAIYLATIYKILAFGVDGSAMWAATINPNTAAGFGAGTPVVGPDGMVYAGGAQTGLSAFNGSGVAQWTTAGYLASLGDDGTIYLVEQSALRALTPLGAQLWSVTFQYGLSEVQPVSAADGTVFVVGGSYIGGGLIAVEATGVPQWEASYPSNLALSPPILGGDGTAYVGTMDIVIADCGPGCPSSTCTCGPETLGSGLRAILPDGGAAWVFGPNAAFASPAIGADGTLYVAASWTNSNAGMPLAQPDAFGGLYALGETP